jgi:hypothetical protein
MVEELTGIALVGVGNRVVGARKMTRVLTNHTRLHGSLNYRHTRAV